MKDFQLIRAVGNHHDDETLLAFRIATLADCRELPLAERRLADIGGSKTQTLIASLGSVNFDHLGRIKPAAVQIGGHRALTSNEQFLSKIHAGIKQRIKLGQGLLGMARSPAYRDLRVCEAWSAVKIAATWGQCRTYFDDDGRATGYLSWAWISDSFAAMVNLEMPSSMHPSEWNEGRTLWFRDIASTPSSVSALGADIAAHMFPDRACLVSVKDSTTGLQRAVSIPLDQRPQLSAWLTAKTK